MTYNIKCTEDTLEVIEKFECAVTSLRYSIEDVIPDNELKDSQIIYQDEYQSFENAWNLYDFFRIVEDKVIPALKSIKCVETKKDTEQIVF